mmetsp:Transcript_36051/g.87136  ORF Transcript_36051/g.87136 Transcript_36051/m.87136 type:complete len:286 (+) Transcript_36051:1220-2077(+)
MSFSSDRFKADAGRGAPDIEDAPPLLAPPCGFILAMVSRTALPSKDLRPSMQASASSEFSKVIYPRPEFCILGVGSLSPSRMSLTSTKGPNCSQAAVKASEDVRYARLEILTLLRDFPFFLAAFSLFFFSWAACFCFRVSSSLPSFSSSLAIVESKFRTFPICSSYSFSRFPKAVRNSSFKGIVCGPWTNPLGRSGSNNRAAHFDSRFLACSTKAGSAKVIFPSLFAGCAADESSSIASISEASRRARFSGREVSVSSDNSIIPSSELSEEGILVLDSSNARGGV